MSAASAFAGLGERVPDPIDMQRAMCPRSIPAVHAMISPRGPKVGICALLTDCRSVCRVPTVGPRCLTLPLSPR